MRIRQPLWETLLEAAGAAFVVGVLAISLATCAQRAFAQQSEIAGSATARDGDDLIINNVDVRLNGFDAPERNKLCGDVNVYDRTTEQLVSITSGQRVRCVIVDHDPRGRPVGRCTVNGEDIGALMVSRGWARDWPRYSGRRYAQAEAAARAAHRGIWGLQCPANLWGRRNYN